MVLSERHCVKPFKSLRQSIAFLNVEERYVWYSMLQYVGYNCVNRSLHFWTKMWVETIFTFSYPVILNFDLILFRQVTIVQRDVSTKL